MGAAVRFSAATLLTIAAHAHPARAQELEPRTYANTAVGVHLIGAAAELRDYEQKTIVGASIRVIAPTGDYDETRLINLGSNRWSYRLEMGAWAIEGIAALWTFGNNDEFINGNYLQQDDLWFGTGGVSYSFRPGFWLGTGVGYGNGGRTSVNGVPRANRQENWRIGATLSYPFNRKHGISLVVGSGFNQGAGNDFDTIAVAYRFAWGKI